MEHVLTALTEDEVRLLLSTIEDAKEEMEDTDARRHLMEAENVALTKEQIKALLFLIEEGDLTDNKTTHAQIRSLDKQLSAIEKILRTALRRFT